MNRPLKVTSPRILPAPGELERVIGRHLWLYASKRCSCGSRSQGVAGTHYTWHIAHLATQLRDAGLVVTA